MTVSIRNLLLVVVALLALSSACLVYSEEIVPQSFYKHVQGDPAQFGDFADPNPSAGSLVSDSYMMEIAFEKEQDGNVVWKGLIPVDSLDHVSVAIISPHSKYMNLQVLNIDDEATKPVNSQVTESWMGYDKEFSVPAKLFSFDNNDQVKTGDWLVQVTFTSSAPKAVVDKYLLNGIHVDAMLVIYNSSPLTAHTQLLSFKTMVGDKVGFVTRISEKAEIEKRSALGVSYVPKALPLSAFEHIEAEMDVILPNGNEKVVPMNDAVSSGMLLVNPDVHHEGSFSGDFVATEKGNFHFRVVVKGVVSEELKTRLFKNAKMIPSQQKITFMRTTQHVITVIDKDLELVGSESISAPSVSFNQLDEMMTVNLQAKALIESAESKKYKAFAEVWAVAADGKTLVPVCWALGMSVSAPSEQGKQHISIPLQFSMKWLSKAGANLPLTLKNVKIQDVATSTTISEVKEMPNLSTYHEQLDEVTRSVKQRVTEQKAVHKFANMLVETLYRFEKNEKPSELMTFGPRPKELVVRQQEKRALSASHKTILVHGYCSSGNPFTASDFQNTVIFSDVQQSRSNDQFAQLIWKLGKDLESFSIVSHSQGGLAGAHLYTFYWSAADNVPKDSKIRILQSVGSPYLGCSAAGGIANVGQIFGAGCGTNNDLSPDGAAKWIKTIPVSTQEKIYYYTTQNTSGGKSCQALMDWVLYKPNDGTTEYKFSVNVLQKATNMGIKYGWCHTSGQNYPPQCTDPERNAELNKYAHGL